MTEHDRTTDSRLRSTHKRAVRIIVVVLVLAMFSGVPTHMRFSQNQRQLEDAKRELVADDDATTAPA